MLSRSLIRAFRDANPRGYLPVYKPRGINCLALASILTKEINYTYNKADIAFESLSIMPAKFMETFADGINTMVINPKDVSRTRNFVPSEYKYYVVVEFGVARRFNCLDGPVIGYSSIKDLTPEMIEEACKTFVGTRVENLQFDFDTLNSDYQISQYGVSESHMIWQEAILDVLKIQDPGKITRVQKYPKATSRRESTCNQIIVKELNLPMGEFEIHCLGTFCPRQFVANLAKLLGTYASITRLTRLQEGPMNMQDMRVLNIQECSPEFYIRNISSISRFYLAYLEKLDDWFEKPVSKRLRL